MSRSIRKPFYYIACCGPVQTDRTIAARGVRRKQNRETASLVKSGEFDDVLLSHKYECPGNNRYSWNCDGRAQYKSAKPSHWHLTFVGIYSQFDLSNEDNRWHLEYHSERIKNNLAWHRELKRK